MNSTIKIFGTIFSSLLLFSACSKENEPEIDNNGETYATTFKITDAPTDNANVEAVFVTISEVRVNGQALEGFNKTTVELSALINGVTETLGNLQLEAGTYSNLELVLDYDTDAAGNAPGAYVLLADGAKDKLESTANTIAIEDSFEVLAQTSNEIVLDFDLRKTVTETESGLQSDFNFVSTGKIASALRLVHSGTTGRIQGTVNDAEDSSDKIIVYAYEKGTFNSEMESQSNGGVQFANAITSSATAGFQNEFSLNFLKEGEYEIIFASYREENGEVIFNGMLEAESTTGLDLSSISINSSLQLALNVNISATF